MLKKCFFCGSSNVVRNGLRGRRQLYKCRDCGRQFIGGQRRDLEGMRYVQKISKDKHVTIQMDTTYWGRRFGLMAIRDARNWQSIENLCTFREKQLNLNPKIQSISTVPYEDIDNKGNRIHHSTRRKPHPGGKEDYGRDCRRNAIWLCLPEYGMRMASLRRLTLLPNISICLTIRTKKLLQYGSRLQSVTQHLIPTTGVLSTKLRIRLSRCLGRCLMNASA